MALYNIVKKVKSMNSLYELTNISKVIEEKLIELCVYPPIILEDIRRSNLREKMILFA
jgi:hypothetical protein